MKVILAPRARLDLLDILDYIAADSPKRALSYIDDIEARCQRIGDAPSGGVLRHDLAPDLRAIPFGAYMIFYRILPMEIRVERILHGARDLKTLFDE